MYHLPKDYCRPRTPLHVNGVHWGQWPLSTGIRHFQMTSKLLDFNLIEHRAGPTNLILGRPHIATCRNLAGRTLNNFKAYFMPDLHPWTVGVAQFEACRKLFFCPKIRINMMNFTAPDRASPNMLDIYDSWSGCLWHDTLDSQWERASVTYHILRAFTAEIWQPRKNLVLSIEYWERTSPILFFILSFLLWNRTHGRSASWQHQLFSIIFSSPVTFDLELSLSEISCHCEIVPTFIKCVVLRSFQIIECARSEDYKAKNWLKLSTCLWF